MLDLIVCDPANPHALRFQVHELRAHLQAVDDAFGSASAGEFAELEARLDECDLSALEPALFGETGRLDAVAGFAALLADVALRARQAADAISFQHFAHVAAAHATLSA